MTTKFVHIGVEETLFQFTWENDDWFGRQTEHLVKLPKDNTYFAIFSPYQDDQLQKLMRSKYYKVLFKSPKAVNKTPGHGVEPRNVLVIFEVRDNGEGN